MAVHKGDNKMDNIMDNFNIPGYCREDTLTLTKEGWKCISDLGDYADIWNGKKFSRSEVFYEEGKVRLYKLTTSCYDEIYLSMSHNLYTYRDNSVIKTILYKVKPNDELLTLKYPVVYSGEYAIRDVKNSVNNFLTEGILTIDGYYTVDSRLRWLQHFFEVTRFERTGSYDVELLYSTNDLDRARSLRRFLQMHMCNGVIALGDKLNIYGIDNISDTYAVLINHNELKSLTNLGLSSIHVEKCIANKYLTTVPHYSNLYVLDISSDSIDVNRGYYFIEPDLNVGYCNSVILS